jgi:malate permease and related proteins
MRTRGEEILRLRPRAVVDMQRVPGPEEVSGHAAAHHAGADECEGGCGHGEEANKFTAAKRSQISPPAGFRSRRERPAIAQWAAVLILNTLAPVFLLIAVGAALQRSRFVSVNFLKEANRVTYYLGLPALLFSQLAGSFHDLSGARLMLGVMLAATGLSVLAAYAVAALLRVPAGGTGTFVQGAFRGNLAFVGLPVIFSLPDAPLAGGLSVRTAAVLTVAPMMVVYNVAGVVVLLLSQHAMGWRMVRPFVRQLATTPPLLATLAGIGFALAGWTLPAAVDKAFHALGEMALPLGLLGVGGSLVTVKFGDHWHRPLVAALLKTALAPLLGWLVGRQLGLGGLELKVLMILLACPTAIISYTMVLELKGDEALASGTIGLSVLTSLVTLAVIVGLA